jgi:NACalpha-BTF3-like transcription factor
MEVEEEEEEEVVGVEEEDLALALAQVMVAGLVMALDMEEGKVIKACHEHRGYLFFFILK